MLYRYRAKNGPRDVVEGTVEAASQAEALEKLHELRYTPIKIEEYKTAPQQPQAVKPLPRGARPRIRGREVTVFTGQLASLLRSGVPILSSLNIIAEQSENAHLKRVLAELHDEVKNGATFSASLAAYPGVFPPIYIAMVRAGETSGALPEVLLRINEFRLRQEEVLSRLRMALAYPILMAVVGIGTVIFMLTFVIPRLSEIFATLGGTLPLPTRIVISVSAWLRKWWVWAYAAGFAAALKWQAGTASGRLYMSRLKLVFPLFGKLLLKIELSRFCRTLEMLLKSGIPILKALEIAVPVVNNQIVRERLSRSHRDLQQGGSFGRSLKDSRLFPAFMSNLIIVGEESGKLNDALAEVADAYEREANEAVKVMTNLLEPLMILAMGVVVGFVVIAMLLPIFEINVMAR